MNEELSLTFRRRGATRRRCFLVLMAFLVSASNLAIDKIVAAPAAGSQSREVDLLIAFDAVRRVAHGMTRNQVVMSMLGEPEEMPCGNLWIYWDFRARGRPPNENYSTLIVVFVEDRVKLIRLADPSAAKRLLSSFRASAPTGKLRTR